ncbi:MAG: N-acetyltransferase [Methanothrix sp.]|nr:N-acetyltransferase [Methanothrix sp.]
MIVVRKEMPDDIAAIWKINEKAFGQPVEANIVDKLRENCSDLLSLVAVQEEQIVGHILFSPARIEGEGKRVEGVGLAPMAVLPTFQRHGIGSRLVQEGINMQKNRGSPFVVVLGHPEFYPRFGFQRASDHGIRSQWDGIPDEAFMILLLNPAAMAGTSGTARYRDEFDEAM